MYFTSLSRSSPQLKPHFEIRSKYMYYHIPSLETNQVLDYLNIGYGFIITYLTPIEIWTLSTCLKGVLKGCFDKMIYTATLVKQMKHFLATELFQVTIEEVTTLFETMSDLHGENSFALGGPIVTHWVNTGLFTMDFASALHFVCADEVVGQSLCDLLRATPFFLTNVLALEHSCFLTYFQRYAFLTDLLCESCECEPLQGQRFSLQVSYDEVTDTCYATADRKPIYSTDPLKSRVLNADFSCESNFLRCNGTFFIGYPDEMRVGVAVCHYNFDLCNLENHQFLENFDLEYTRWKPFFLRLLEKMALLYVRNWLPRTNAPLLEKSYRHLREHIVHLKEIKYLVDYYYVDFESRVQDS